MTDTTEQKALALVNEVRAERRDPPMKGLSRDCFASQEALCRAIEQHEAFRQEVSDAMKLLSEEHEAFRQEVSDAVEEVTQRQGKLQSLLRFIIAKPDPLVEALHGVYFSNYGPENVRLIRAAIEENGGKIVWREG